MSRKQIWLSSPHPSGEEMKYIEEAFSKGQIFPNGANVDSFEEDLKAFTGAQHASCLSSGTAAIHLALIGLGVEQGDEVICSSFTFSASANPIAYQKATPIFIDSAASTWNMNPCLLEEAIKDRIRNGKRPKAIIVVHLYGMPAQMDLIMKIAHHYEIPVIEDAAEALGSKFDGKACGTIGDIGILSFNGNKIITTSGGGAMISDNQEFTNLAKFLGTQARDPFPYYQHSHIGYNYRMSNICAGIGRGQMEVLENRVQKRRENHYFYSTAFKDMEGINMLEEPDKRYYSNFWLSTILVNPEKTNGISREDIRLKLGELNIETRPLWKPMHLQPIFSNSPVYEDGTSQCLFDIGLCLPSSSNITDSERLFVVESIKEILT